MLTRRALERKVAELEKTLVETRQYLIETRAALIEHSELCILAGRREHD